MAEDDTPTYRTFTDSTIALLGTSTSDGRVLAADIDLRFRTFPQPLMWTKQTGYGHDDAFTVGVLESAKVDGDKVVASGYMLNTPEADEAAEQMGHGVTGPSVDLADTEWMLTDADGKEIAEEDWWDLPMDAEVYQTITSAELIGTTLVATPAFGDTAIVLNSERETRDVALVAASVTDFQPRTYPATMFADPKLSGPTLPTISEDGRVYGHLAVWNEEHAASNGRAIFAPKSRTAYAYFHTSPPVRLDDGSQLAVGRLTVGCGHANERLGAAAALAHYDEAGTCFALVRVGEDRHGIWFSGVPAPWATHEQIEMGLSAPLSGDWRERQGNLELHAALAVNSPGFRIAGSTDDTGRPLALVASLGPNPRTATRGGVSMSSSEVKAVVRDAISEFLAETARRDDASKIITRRREEAAAAQREFAQQLITRNEARALVKDMGERHGV